MNKILIILFISFSFSCSAQHYGLNRNYEGGGQIIKYGFLYNWYAVDLSAGDTITSSDDWHVSTDAELSTLITYLGGSGVAGGKLKEAGLTYWQTPNTGATNEVSFNGRGSGSRGSGAFAQANLLMQMWLSDEFSATDGNMMYLIYTTNNTVQTNGFKYGGKSIRLIKNSTTLSEGEEGTYTGNDGTVYRTIAIGTSPVQEWLADNLAETKFRSGNWITGYDGGVYTPISDVNWAAKTTEAMCAYDDDLGNVFQ